MCRFTISPCAAEIKWPTSDQKTSPETEMGRHDELWKHTCFELFLGLPGESGYVELNVTSDGKWQCYQFDEVRKGMRYSEMLLLETRELTLNPKEASFEFTLIHGFTIDASTKLKTGISVVIETESANIPTSSDLHYYALIHPGVRPDFHHRDAHIIQLAPDQL